MTEPTYCAVCGERLAPDTVVCTPCEERDRLQSYRPQVESRELGEAAALLKRARRTLVAGLIVFPWVLQIVAFFMALAAIRRNQTALQPDSAIRTQAVLILVLSAALTVFSWLLLFRLLRP